MKTPVLQIIDNLNNLLDDTLSPHAVSFEFDKQAQKIRELKIKIKVTFTKSFYLDEELDNIHQKKIDKNTPFDVAASLRKQELELLKQKSNEPTAILKTEPSIFEYDQPHIVAYLNSSKRNQRLLAQLVNDYQIN